MNRVYYLPFQFGPGGESLTGLNEGLDLAKGADNLASTSDPLRTMNLKEGKPGQIADSAQDMLPSRYRSMPYAVPCYYTLSSIFTLHIQNRKAVWLDEMPYTRFPKGETCNSKILA